MNPPRIRPLARAAWAAALLLLAAGPPARGEEPGPPADPYKVVVVSTTTTATPYWGYVRDPYGLHGRARLLEASANYHLVIQKAVKAREEARRDKLKTAEARLRYLRWERNFLWEMREEEAQRTIRFEEKRAIENPANTEILGGTALNFILRNLTKDSQSSRAVSEPLRQEWLDNVNFVCTSGNAGVLRQKQLSWTLLLRGDDLADSRARVEKLLEQGRQEVQKGDISAATVAGLLAEYRRLDAAATAEMRRPDSVWDYTQQVMANRFLKELNQSLLLLRNPKEARYLLTYTPRCKTVAELVREMEDGRLAFGPASLGSERFYLNVYAAFSREAKRRAKERGDSSLPQPPR
jgi:hypothetical protein